MKVLITEDDKLLLQFLRQMVEEWGHEVIGAYGGEEAWDHFQNHADIAMVITDWMMPGVNGLELIERIRACQRPGYVYIILLTARSRTEDIVLGMESGADDFLVKPFDKEELHVRLRAGQRILELEQNLARRNAELEEANQRMRRDLQAATLVQQSLLPTALPNGPKAQFAWAFQPCGELSGDSLGIMPLDDRHVALHVLDVSGHGVSAALLSVSVSHFLSPVYSSSSLLRQRVPGSASWRVVPPTEVADELNRRFPFNPETARFFTLLYGLLDLDRSQFRYVSAGHPGPIHLPAQGEPVLLKASGLPIGLKEKDSYKEQVLPLNPGDRLYLFTDGIWEATGQDKQQFGTRQFLPALQKIRDLPLQRGLDILLESVFQWCGTSQLKDDASLLAIEIG
jgi:sigma-B regulation protein RsbU (phosphoserine phosphatase)